MNRYRARCATKGGVPRHVIVYARSKPKAEQAVLDGPLGVGNGRITRVIEVVLSPVEPPKPK